MFFCNYGSKLTFPDKGLWIITRNILELEIFCKPMDTKSECSILVL